MPDPDLEARVASIPWFHSIDLGPITTPGRKSPAQLAHELQRLRLPELAGKSVLDIGAFDGFYSFESERRGAARVVALDHYVWSLDLTRTDAEWRQLREQGIVPPPADQSAHWRPDELPGKRGYDTAHQVLSSRVETVVDDFMTMDLTGLGTFDVVLYLGVLYHIENPLQALRRLASVTAGVAIIETEAVEFQLAGRARLCEFFEGGELNHDTSNWWAPNRSALEGMCRSAGFREVQVVIGPPSWPRWLAHTARARIRHEDPGNPRIGVPVRRYRAVVHAFK
jgi:tRNA (mo5U34)-methyltransferase